ncbi:MAG: hypothetical protein ACM3S2_06985 [Ignavibacteriales bacterium]
MNKKALSVWIVLIAILAVNLPVMGQEITKSQPEYKDCFWVNGGIGGSYFGPTLNGSISYSHNENTFTIRYLKADEFTWGDPGGNKVSDYPPLSMKEIGILCGRSTRMQNMVISLSGGLSYLTAVNRGSRIEERLYEKQEIKAIGIPLELHVRIELTDFLGIGGSCFGNLNSSYSFIGGSLNLYIGKF